MDVVMPTTSRKVWISSTSAFDPGKTTTVACMAPDLARLGRSFALREMFANFRGEDFGESEMKR
jgi:hypothetical protein